LTGQPTGVVEVVMMVDDGVVLVALMVFLCTTVVRFAICNSFASYALASSWGAAGAVVMGFARLTALGFGPSTMMARGYFADANKPPMTAMETRPITKECPKCLFMYSNSPLFLIFLPDGTYLFFMKMHRKSIGNSIKDMNMPSIDKIRTALIVIDLQKGIMGRQIVPYASEVVIKNATALASAFRKNISPKPDSESAPSWMRAPPES